jgi:hypothetical protein
MGCNYFLRTNQCNDCNRYDEKHIGKSSAGWRFTFRGYRHFDFETDQEVTVIGTLAKWKELFFTDGAQIFDEYGKEITIPDFLAKVEAKRKDHYALRNIDDWLDGEGNYFCDADFS